MFERNLCIHGHSTCNIMDIWRIIVLINLGKWNIQRKKNMLRNISFNVKSKKKYHKYFQNQGTVITFVCDVIYLQKWHFYKKQISTCNSCGLCERLIPKLSHQLLDGLSFLPSNISHIFKFSIWRYSRLKVWHNIQILWHNVQYSN